MRLTDQKRSPAHGFHLLLLVHGAPLVLFRLWSVGFLFLLPLLLLPHKLLFNQKEVLDSFLPAEPQSAFEIGGHIGQFGRVVLVVFAFSLDFDLVHVRSSTRTTLLAISS